MPPLRTLPPLPPLRLGTRASALAVAQSSAIARLVEQHSGRAVELVHVTTTGDRSRAPLATIGGTGVFVTALREALVAGHVDLAVHSLKDLPTAPAAGLVIAAVPAREDPRDALVARDGLTLRELPAGARVGTGSPRRAAQLRALRPDLEVVDLRGNVDTRLANVAEGRLDAVVLALAGLRRLGRDEAVTEVLDPADVLPAPGQGALAVECRAGDDEVTTALAPLDDVRARAAVTAERQLLARLEAGCSAPVGALATFPDGERGTRFDGAERMVLDGVVGALDGSVLVRASQDDAVGAAVALGSRLADTLLRDPAVAPLLRAVADPATASIELPVPATGRPLQSTSPQSRSPQSTSPTATTRETHP
ncbi:MAG: hydroxymethylbilane synthase [Actinomycetales bacterium]